jgi:hypothetical protein
MEAIGRNHAGQSQIRDVDGVERAVNNDERFDALGSASDVPIASPVHRKRGADALRDDDRALSDWSDGSGVGVSIAIEIHP